MSIVYDRISFKECNIKYANVYDRSIEQVKESMADK